MKIKYTGMELKLHRHGIRIALASVFGAMLTATPLVGDSALANGIVMGKVFWFHLSMVLMAIGTIVTIGFGGKKSVSFSLPDGLLLLFAGVTLVTYDWQLGPEPEKLLFGGRTVVARKSRQKNEKSTVSPFRKEYLQLTYLNVK